jgi:hypothetical protein
MTQMAPIKKVAIETGLERDRETVNGHGGLGVGEVLLGAGLERGAVGPEFAVEMDEEDATDGGGLELGEELVGIDVGSLTEQQMERLGEERFEIGESTNVGGVPGPTAVVFEEEAEGFEGGVGMGGDEAGAEGLEVAGGKRGDAERA